MIGFLFLMLSVLFLPGTTAAAFDPALIENVARGYATVQPGLNTYQVELKTSKLAEMLTRMTANMPADLPRPSNPVLRKYWSRTAGTSIIRAEGPNVFPYMQEMVERFSAEFAVDLRNLFLPLAGAEARRRLLEKAAVKTYETLLGESRLQNIELTFSQPTDLGGAFFSDGLSLPQQSVTGLTLELDPDLKVLNRLEIATADGQRLAVEIRHEKLPGGLLPQEISITTPDGSIDDHLVTTFSEIEGYRLPTEQLRTIQRPGRQETLSVIFTDYRLNAPLPEDVEARLKNP